MNKLEGMTNEEMLGTNGGSFLGTVAAVIAIGYFVVDVYNGYKKAEREDKEKVDVKDFETTDSLMTA